MPQQQLQQTWPQEFYPSTVSVSARAPFQPGTASPGSGPSAPRPGTRGRLQPRLAAPPLTAIVIVIAASLLLGLFYISANAQAAQREYVRQALLRETAALRAHNLALRCELSQRADLGRVTALALAVGMRPADPAAETDFVSRPVPPQQDSQALAARQMRQRRIRLTSAPSVTALAAVSFPRSKARPAWFNQGPLLVDALARQFSVSVAGGRAEASTPAQPARR